jgi:hypothetical protein
MRPSDTRLPTGDPSEWNGPAFTAYAHPCSSAIADGRSRDHGDDDKNGGDEGLLLAVFPSAPSFFRLKTTARATFTDNGSRVRGSEGRDAPNDDEDSSKKYTARPRNVVEERVKFLPPPSSLPSLPLSGKTYCVGKREDCPSSGDEGLLSPRNILDVGDPCRTAISCSCARTLRWSTAMNRNVKRIMGTKKMVACATIKSKS